MAKWRPRVPEADRVPELELGRGRFARRQVDQLQAAGHEVQRAIARRAVDPQRARRAARPQPGRRDHGAQRHEQVVGQVGQDRPALAGIGDGAQRPEQPGVVQGDLAGPRAAHDVDHGQGHGRCRHPGPGARRGDDEVRRDRPRRWPPWPRPGGPGRRGRRPCAGRRRRRRRPTTGRCAARASGRGCDGDRRRWSSTRPPRRPRCRRARRGRRRRSARWPSAAWRRPSPADGPAMTRTAASWPRTTVSTRRSRTSARDWVAAATARRPSSGSRAASMSSCTSGQPSSARADGPSRTSPGRPFRSPKAASPSDIAPARMTGTLGTRAAAAATSAASSRSAPRSSAPGGSSAPARMASTDRSASSRVMASGSVDWTLAPLMCQPLRAAQAVRAASERSEPATMASRPGRRETRLDPGQDVRPDHARRGAQPGGRRDARVARGDAPQEQLDGALRCRPRRGWPGCPAGATRRPRGRCSAMAVVAAPRSMVRKACGSAVTRTMLPGHRRTRRRRRVGSPRLRRPRRPRRRAPRGGR